MKPRAMTNLTGFVMECKDGSDGLIRGICFFSALNLMYSSDLTIHLTLLGEVCPLGRASFILPNEDT